MKMLRKLKETMIVLVALMAMLIAAPLVVDAAEYCAMTITATQVDHAAVAYVYVTSNDNGALELVEMESGDSFHESQFAYDYEYYGDKSSYDGYVMFFVKPLEGYLLTNLTVGTTNASMFPIDSIVRSSNHSGYYRIGEVVALAKQEGYIAGFGYSRTSGTSEDYAASFSISGTDPALTLNARSNKTNAEVNDTVTFTVTVTPSVPGINNVKSKITDIVLKVNGVEPDSGNVTYSANYNGSYTITVKHTVTEADVRAGAVQLTVDATAAFTYDLNLGYTNLNATTTTTASASDSVYVPITDRFSISYEWENAPSSLTIPTGTTVGWRDGYRYTVNNTYYKGYTVEGEANNQDGEWRFSGWMLDDEVVSGTIDVQRNITLKGVWEFVGDTYRVTFTDGDGSGAGFTDVVKYLPVSGGESELTAVPDIEDDLYGGYILAGWKLVSGGDSDGDGGWVNGTVYSPSELEGATVYGNMEFDAVYSMLHRGIVYVVLDGTYDSATHTASGDFVSIEQVMGSGAALFVSPVGSDKMIELMPGDNNGMYYAELEPGDYNIYYYDGDEYILDEAHSGQPQLLSISGGDRSRYVFFYTLTHTLNGGEVYQPLPDTYHRFAAEPEVTDIVPVREGFRFLGWELSADAEIYEAGDILPPMYERFTLSAQWEEDIYAYVNLFIKVDKGENTDPTDAITVQLTYNDGDNYVATQDAPVVWPVSDWLGGGMTTNNVVVNSYENIYADLDADEEYALNLFLQHYEVSDMDVELEYDEDGNHIYNVYAILTYDPHSFDLAWSVDVADDTPAALIPLGVDIKVISYDHPTEGDWAPIIRHESSTIDTVLGTTTAVSGSYEVPSILPVDRDDDTNNDTAYYRIGAVGFTVKDANGNTVELTATTNDDVNFYSAAAAGYPAGAYHAVLAVDGAQPPASGEALDGVYYNGTQQQGTLTLTITAQSYDVFLNWNYPGQSTYAIERDVFLMPDLSGYQPTRDGHTFGGWFTAPECADGDEVQPGTVLNGDTTVYAKWKPHRTVSGTVSVAGFYNQPTLDGGWSTQIIDPVGRAKTAVVALQHIDENGYAVTMYVQTVTFGEYIGDAPVAKVDYAFNNVPDDGHEHRILVLSHNYEDTYQNEPDSLTAGAAYNDSDFIAVYGDDDVAVINAYLAFNPAGFDLPWQVDATAISTSFRPDEAQVLVLYDDGQGGWPVITQMKFGAKEIGITTPFENGVASEDFFVWDSLPDGQTLYRYAVKLKFVDGGSYEYSDATFATAPFEISYSGQGAYNYNGAASSTPVITLTPKAYDINYKLQTTDTVSGMDAAPTQHKWSFVTDISGVVPQRDGYEFRGWYADADCSGNPVTAIEAAVAEEVTLYAKWVQVQDVVNVTVTLIHNGAAFTNNRDLKLQLTSAAKTRAIYSDEVGKLITVPQSVWHTAGDNAAQDTYTLTPAWTGLSEEYLYSVNAFMHDYTVTEKTVTPSPDSSSGITTYDVAITMEYRPHMLDLKFDVEIADGNKNADDKPFWPVSAEIKVLRWYTADGAANPDWNIIPQHENTTVTVNLDEDGKGSGTYPVWQYADENTVYHYRIAVVGVTMSNGNVVPMTYHEENVGGVADPHYHSLNEIYQARVAVDGGAAPSGSALPGVYGGDSGQNGTVTATISVFPHTLQLDPMGGTINDDTAVKDLGKFIYMPELRDYAPERNGYTFAGWYTEEECINANTFATGAVLTENLALYAKWTPVEYSITYVKNGGNWVNAEGKLNYTSDDADYTLPAVKMTDYIFAGWYTEPGGSGDNVTVLPAGSYGHKVYYAHWLADKLADAAASDTDNITADSLSGGDGIADMYQAVVRYAVDDTASGAVDKNFEVVTIKDGYNLATSGTVVADGATVTPNDGYAFIDWDNDYSATFEEGKGVKSADIGMITFAATGGSEYSFTAYCGLDSNGDHVADAQQWIITFEVVNGTWDGTNAAAKTVYITKDENGIAKLSQAQIPSNMQPINANFGSAAWAPYEPTTTQEFGSNFTFRYVFAQTIYSVTYDDARLYDSGLVSNSINVAAGREIELDLNGGEWADDSLALTRTIERDITLERPVRSGYTFIGWLRNITDNSTNVAQVFTAQWEKDVWHDTKDSLNEGDGIPDKYQAAVQYLAGDNGRLSSGAAEVFTLTADGKYAESGSVTAAGAVAQADHNYTFVIWSNPCNAVFAYDEADTGDIGIDNARGGSSYTFAASFAYDVWADAAASTTDSITADAVTGGDGVPDYQQFVFYFNAQRLAVVNGQTGQTEYLAVGSLNGPTPQVITLTDHAADNKYSGSVTPETVTPVPLDGYAFDYWSRGGNTNVSVDPFAQTTVVGGQTVTYAAHFGVDENGDNKPDSGQVLFRFEVAAGDGAKGSISGDGVWQALNIADGNSYAPSLDNVYVHNADGYTLDYWTVDGGTIAINPEGAWYNLLPGGKHIFYAHFTPDVLVDTTMPDYDGAVSGDGIADKYQHTIIYKVIGCTHVEGSEDTEIYTMRYYSTADEHGRITSHDRESVTVLGDRMPVPSFDGTHKGAWDVNITAQTPVSGDATYTYTITDKTNHLLSYDLNGGSPAAGTDYTTNTYLEGDTATVAAAPSRVGYTFTGWLNGTAYQPGNTITFNSGMGDIHLIAQWQAVEYTISYTNVDDAGGMDGAWDKYTVESETYTLPKPTKSGFVFEGWLEDGTPVTKLEAGSTGNKTYTATWAEDVWSDAAESKSISDGIADKYQIAVEYAAGNGGSVNKTLEIYTLRSGSAYAVSGNITLDGAVATANSDYAFDGWTDTADDSYAASYQNAKPATGAITLLNADGGKTYTFTAAFAEDSGDGVPDKYQAQVTFSISNGLWQAGGSGDAYSIMVNLYNDQDELAADGVGHLSNAQLPQGMVPLQYYGNGGWVGQAPTVTIPISKTQNNSFDYAYERLVYRVSYTNTAMAEDAEEIYAGLNIKVDPNGGKWQHGAAEYTAKQTLLVDADTQLADATRTGYTFGGWEAVGALDSGYTFTANWTPIDYDIIYVENGGTAVADGTYTIESADITLPTTITKTGYTFGGWYTDENCTDGNKVETIPQGSTGNKTFYAKWIVDTYNIEYEMKDDNTHTATWRDNNAVVTQYTVEDEVTLPLPMRANYGFAGWYENDQYTGSAVTKITKCSTGNKTFYAKWIADTYTIVYEENGGTQVPDGTYTVESLPVTLPTAISRSGYVFEGWYLESDFSGDKQTELPQGSSGYKRYFAKWAEDVWKDSGVADNTGDNFTDSDNTADYKQAAVEFVVADGHTGSLSGVLTQVFTLNDVNGQFSGSITPSEVTAVVYNNDQSAFDHWTDINGNIVDNPFVATAVSGGQKLVYTAHFSEDANNDEKPDLKQVLVYFESADTAKGAVSAPCKAFDTENIYINLDGVSVAPASGYVLDRWQQGGQIVTLPGDFHFYLGSKHTFKAYWAEDKLADAEISNTDGINADSLSGGDGIADHYQYVVTYKLAGDLSGGSWTNASGGDDDIIKVFTQAGYHTADDTGRISWPAGTTAPVLGTTVPTPYINDTEKYEGSWDVEPTATTQVTGNATYTYTIVEKHQHTVSYVLNGGSGTFAPQQVYHGSDVTIHSTEPTRTHYTFGGWSDGSNTYAKGATISDIHSDITLTAQWTPVVYTITYEENGGSTVADATYTVLYSDIILLSTAREHYRFAGWYDNAQLNGTPVTKLIAKDGGDKTYHAKWEPINYNIYYYGVTGASGMDSALKSYNVTDGAITLPTPAKSGYSFGGWYDNAQLTGDSISVQPADATGDKHYYAKWTTDAYSIDYQLNGGDWNGATPKTSYTIEDATYYLLKPVKADYDFGGWFDNSGFSGIIHTAVQQGSTGDKMFYAKWTPVVYTITYENVDGASGMGGKLESYTVESLTEDYVLPTPTKPGYVFEGWTEDGSAVTKLAVGSTGNKVYTANWAVDKWSDARDSLSGGDGIADYKQAVV